MTERSAGALPDAWPELPYEAWKDTCATLHLWAQIVGKVRLALTPWVNHSWHATLYVTPRGLTTGSIPYGDGTFQIDFDMIDHELRIGASDGLRQTLPLEPQSVADFYQAVVAALARLDIHVKINKKPNEVPDPIPFDEDRAHASYDRDYANRFWRVLLQSDRVFRRFRTGYWARSARYIFFGVASIWR